MLRLTVNVKLQDAEMRTIIFSKYLLLPVQKLLSSHLFSKIQNVVTTIFSPLFLYGCET